MADQAKARLARQAQARPSQGKAQQASQPSQGCAGRARNPKGPQTYLFVTKWVAIQPFCTSEAGSYAEFRRGSRQIGPTPSISTFFRPFLSPKKAQKCIFWEGFEKIFENRPGWPKIAPQGRPAGWPAGRIFSIFLIFFFHPKLLGMGPRGPGGPWGGPPGGGPGEPWAPPY